jgi:type IV pilus assembly protein PilY1
MVGTLEGIASLGTTYPYNGCCNDNSALIAGLAYDSHVNDIRSDLAGKQTISTYWLDVAEYAAYKNNNQYYLATKYGGFKVPATATYNYGGALTESWWHANTQTYGTNKKPDNYYMASQANQMVDGLRTAFANISTDIRSSAASVAANSTRVDTSTAVFQAAFDSGNWSGDVLAYLIGLDGVLQLLQPGWQRQSWMP